MKGPKEAKRKELRGETGYISEFDVHSLAGIVNDNVNSTPFVRNAVHQISGSMVKSKHFMYNNNLLDKNTVQTQASIQLKKEKHGESLPKNRGSNNLGKYMDEKGKG